MLKNSKDSTKTWRCKINIQKSVVLLYTKNKLSEKEIKETISLRIASKRIIIYLGINLTKEVKDLYNENYKTFIKKKIEEDTNKWI